MDMGLLLAIIAVTVAGLAAVIGLWMERDPNRPPRWAWSLSILIIMTTVTTVATSWWDDVEDERREEDAITRHGLQMKNAEERQAALVKETDFLKEAAAESKTREEKMAEDIARMLVTLDQLAGESNDPKLKAFINEEVSSQSRGSEDVVKRVAQRVKDQGGDPDAMLGRHLSKEELSRVTRKITFAPPSSMKDKMNSARGAASQAPKGTSERGDKVGRPTGRPTAPKPTKSGGRPTGSKNKNKGRP